MSKKYTPAVFQPTVRPSWAGTLSYISEKERSLILEAIIRFPEQIEIESRFWEETIKPDLQEQYDNFIAVCLSRGRGAKTYWGEHKDTISLPCVDHKDTISLPQGELMDNSLKDKDKDKNQYKDKDKNQDKDKECVKYKKVNSNIPLDCSVKEALEKWLAYKKERNQSYKPTGLKACIEKLERLSSNDSALAMRIVEESISNNWSGLFPLKDKKSIGQSINEKNWKIIQDTFGLGEENADIR